MTSLYHISRFKPTENSGGVAIFGRYLGRAVPGIEFISFEDFPERKAIYEQNPREYELAENLNAWLLSTGALNESSTVIVDGYWGLGLQGKVKRLISVCHGSYWGRFVRAQACSWGEVVGFDYVDAQTEMWESDGVEIACVGQEPRREVLQSCRPQVNPVVIHNGVDTEVLCPKPDIERSVWMHAATSSLKGLAGILSLSTDHNIRLEFMGQCETNEAKADRLNHAVVMVVPSHYEGNAYLWLEAMSCGVPLIASAVGAGTEMDERCGVVTDDLAPQNLARILRGFHSEQYSPREWVLENATFEKFALEWRGLLDVS